MSARAKRFRVAFSFAGEKRDFVAKVAAILAKRFGEEHILYDKYCEAEFARARLGRYLPRLYHEKSDLIAVIICRNYATKEWCGLEWDAIFDLLKGRHEDEVMLCRFDRATVEGLFSDAGFVELDDKTTEQAAVLILERLALNEGRSRDYYLADGAVADAVSPSLPAGAAPDEAGISRIHTGAPRQASTSTTFTPSVPRVPPENHRGRRIGIIAGVALMIVIGAIIAVWYWYQPATPPRPPDGLVPPSAPADSQAGRLGARASQPSGQQDRLTPIPMASSTSSPPAGKRLFLITIEITEVPPDDQGNPDRSFSIEGVAGGVDPEDYKVVIYAYGRGRWRVQPLVTAPLTDVRKDGGWQTKTYRGTQYAALLVKKTYQPQASISTLPEVDGDVVAVDRKPEDAVRIKIGTVSQAEDGGDRKGCLIGGVVAGVDPEVCRVIVYAFDGQSWWIQPSADAPQTEIAKDGIWSTRTSAGSRYAAMLVRGHANLPIRTLKLPELRDQVLARDLKEISLEERRSP